MQIFARSDRTGKALSVNSKKSRSRGPSPEQIRTQVEKGQLAPFYLVYGLEEYGRTAFVRWLMDKLAPQQAREFNMDVFRAAQFDPLDMLQIYESYPMMAERRLVVLQDCDSLAPEQCKALETLIDRPVETSCLLLVGAKVDMRRRLFQQMGKLGQAIEFRPPYDREVPEWIGAQVRSMGLSIESAAVDLLRMYVGNNPRELVSELEKVTTFMGEGETAITRQAVETVTAVSRQVNVFELADAVGARKAHIALSLLNRYLDQGEDVNRALAMIVRHFSLLLKIRVHAENGASKEEMARLLGISPFFMSSYIDQAKRQNVGALWRSMGFLRQADWQLRSLGRRQERAVMDRLMVNLCARSPG